MFRKRFLIYSLSVLFLVAAAACSKKQTVDTSSTEPDIEVTTTPETPATEVTETPTGEGDVEGREVKMPVLEDVFFAFDKSDLTSEARRKLANNASQLKDASDASVTIEGHCDERGTNAYNLALGERRAKAAKDYLVSLGVSAARLKTVSYGEERPFDSGHDEAAWAKNRRAHFVMSGN